MALSLNATESCKHLSVIINYTVQTTTNFTLVFLNADGNNVSGTVTPNFSISPGDGPINYRVPVTNLDISNGIITVVFKTSVGVEVDRKTVLLHCDIDCCLTKLTNELIDCACDCAKCASSLAKAQKVFLLVKSADYAVSQANDAPAGRRPGYIEDANSKYLKAKEICDESCGCDC